MKLKKQVSTQQKSLIQKAPIVLAALLFMGIFSTQINHDKEIEGLNNLKPNPSLNLTDDKLESLNQQENEQIQNLSKDLASHQVEVDKPKVEEVREINSTNKTIKKARVKSPQTITQTTSAVAYTSMNMQVADYTGKLSWGSSFQRNIQRFVVERSVDDEYYTEIGHVQGEGKGEFKQKNLYQFEDTSLMFVQMPSVLYRIKQIGVYGDEDYSEPIAYDLGVPEGLYASIDVQEQKQLLIQYAATTASSVDYKILNAFGEAISQGSLEGEYDPKSFTIKTDTWEKGAYYLKLEAGKFALMEAFVLP